MYPRSSTGQSIGLLNRGLRVRLAPRVPLGIGVTEARVPYKYHAGVRLPDALLLLSSNRLEPPGS